MLIYLGPCDHRVTKRPKFTDRRGSCGAPPLVAKLLAGARLLSVGDDGPARS
jgi:hypothetical protein